MNRREILILLGFAALADVLPILPDPEAFGLDLASGKATRVTFYAAEKSFSVIRFIAWGFHEYKEASIATVGIKRGEMDGPALLDYAMNTAGGRLMWVAPPGFELFFRPNEKMTVWSSTPDLVSCAMLEQDDRLLMVYSDGRLDAFDKSSAPDEDQRARDLERAMTLRVDQDDDGIIR